MKILLDTCVWGGSRQQLEIAGHDAIWTGDWPEDPGDKDFGELAIV
jgi:predicted nuclease of predicted toxin-antitoxin system